MSDTFERIKRLVARQAVRISEHGYDELAADDIFARDIMEGIAQGKAMWNRPCLSQPIDRTQPSGKKVLRGGEHEDTEADEIDS